MNRREILFGAVLALVAGPAFADTRKGGTPRVANRELVAAAARCMGSGDACLAHCMDRLDAGDTSMASCARAVSDLVAICQALTPMATSQSPHLPQMIALAKDVTRDCKAECDKHATMPTCKACADSCAELLAALG